MMHIRNTKAVFMLVLFWAGFFFCPMFDSPVFGDRETQFMEITALKTYAMWKNSPQSTHILDVRSAQEYALTGHPPMAHNIPLAFWTDRYDALRNTYLMEQNPDFVKQAKERFPKDETLLVLCRSGIRSETAARLLVRAGFTKVYNIIDGTDGPRHGSVAAGREGAAGWKNSGAPWTYNLDSTLIHSP
jgi:rhodanese-related sulfurtransferase